MQYGNNIHAQKGLIISVSSRSICSCSSSGSGMASLKCLDLPLILGEYQCMLGVCAYVCVWELEIREKKEKREKSSVCYWHVTAMYDTA